MISKNKHYRGNFLLVLMVVFALIALGSTAFIFLKQEKNIGNKIYPNVYLDNQNFGLKSKDEIVDFYKKKSSELMKHIKY